MPDRASTPVYDKCTSCAFASEKGSVSGVWPKSHTDVCCLYKFNRQEQSASCHLKAIDQKANGTCEGLCKDCPSRLKLPQLHIELPSQISSDEGATDVPQSCTSVKSKTPKSSKIAPRMRRGFTKLTIEIRPPKFKKKLWFGTWTEGEIERAKDAINFYMGGKEPFILADSPLIFAQHPLGIEYRDLMPSCEEFLQVGQNRVRASVHFARRVKEVIKAVTRGKSKKAPHTSRKPKSHGAIPPQIIQAPLISGSPASAALPCPSSSTTSSVMPCASGSQFSSGDDMVWYGEANSALPLPSDVPTYEGDIPMEAELLNSLCNNWDEEVFSLEGITFSSSPSAAASGEGESGMGDESGFPACLWS